MPAESVGHVGVRLERHAREDRLDLLVHAPAAVDLQGVLDAVEPGLQLVAPLDGQAGAPRGDTRPAVRPAGPSPRATSSKTVPLRSCGTSCGSMAVTQPLLPGDFALRSARSRPGSAATAWSCPSRCGPSRQTRSPGSIVRLARSKTGGPRKPSVTSDNAINCICAFLLQQRTHHPREVLDDLVHERPPRPFVLAHRIAVGEVALFHRAQLARRCRRRRR